MGRRRSPAGANVGTSRRSTKEPRPVVVTEKRSGAIDAEDFGRSVIRCAFGGQECFGHTSQTIRLAVDLPVVITLVSLTVVIMILGLSVAKRKFFDT